jgi:hypothetical protein
MGIQHQIIEFNPTTVSIVVKYWTEQFPEGLVFNIDLPIIDGQFPPDDEIENVIKTHEPKSQIERLIQTPTLNIPDNFKQKISASNAETTPADLAAFFRRKRDILLAQSDWTQLSDAPINAMEKNAWVVYRQELRDLPQQSNFPDGVIFPARPDEEFR